jgi:hypothetical protein
MALCKVSSSFRNAQQICCQSLACWIETAAWPQFCRLVTKTDEIPLAIFSRLFGWKSQSPDDSGPTVFNSILHRSEAFRTTNCRYPLLPIRGRFFHECSYSNLVECRKIGIDPAFDPPTFAQVPTADSARQFDDWGG